MSSKIEDILAWAYNSNAGDLFLAAGKKPRWRRCGKVDVTPAARAVSGEEIDAFRQKILAPGAAAEYARTGSADCAWTHEKGLRFRINFFETFAGSSMAVRPISDASGMTFESLHLPRELQEVCRIPRGLILLAGSTGSGKSTTLAAMVNELNQNTASHILTLEDPVEFLHTDAKSLVSQREISAGAGGFGAALRSALRENPDVIVIGEMRDLETMTAAVNAALTGHLVIATVHTADTVQAVERIVNEFPETRRERAAADLAMALIGIYAQRLLPMADGSGMIPALEMLPGSPTVRKLVGNRNFYGLDEWLRRGGERGMISFARSIFRRYRDGEVALDDARRAVDNPDEFDLFCKGMERGVDTFQCAYCSTEDREDGVFVDLRSLLRNAVKLGASDLILTCGVAPTLRICGEMRAMDLPELAPTDIQRLLLSVLTPHQRVAFEEQRELDFALSAPLRIAADQAEMLCRFRLNAFYQRGGIGLVARVIPSGIPDPATLTLPMALCRVIDKRQGLVLITGPTGSGKSTTLASLIDQINRKYCRHIVTIEDPIEYVHENHLSVLEQRELHADTLSFAGALKHALRQAPDVIMVGEMRDVETMAAALTAAETGHLVFATIHTNSAPQTVDRIIDSFPQAHQNQIRMQLSAVLLAVVSQRLLPREDGNGRVAAFEVMMGTPPVQALIRDGKTHQLPSAMEVAQKDGMVTMARALEDLYSAGKISRTEMERMMVDYQQVTAF